MALYRWVKRPTLSIQTVAALSVNRVGTFGNGIACTKRDWASRFAGVTACRKGLRSAGRDRRRESAQRLPLMV